MFTFSFSFRIYGEDVYSNYLAEHFQEQTENISVWRWRALAHLLHLANLGYISVIIIIYLFNIGQIKK